MTHRENQDPDKAFREKMESLSLSFELNAFSLWEPLFCVSPLVKKSLSKINDHETAMEVRGSERDRKNDLESGREKQHQSRDTKGKYKRERLLLFSSNALFDPIITYKALVLSLFSSKAFPRLLVVIPSSSSLRAVNCD